MYREGDCPRVVFSFYLFLFFIYFAFLFGVWILLRGRRRGGVGDLYYFFCSQATDFTRPALPGLRGIEVQSLGIHL